MIKDTFSLSDKGMSNIRIGILLTSLHNLSVMLPTVLLLLLSSNMIQRYLGRETQSSSLFAYWSLALLLLILIYWIYKFTYRKTYVVAYEESANTRITLAEKIRKLPLSYFGNKNLSDLTSTLMDDTSTIENTLSNGIA